MKTPMVAEIDTAQIDAILTIAREHANVLADLIYQYMNGDLTESLHHDIATQFEFLGALDTLYRTALIGDVMTLPPAKPIAYDRFRLTPRQYLLRKIQLQLSEKEEVRMKNQSEEME